MICFYCGKRERVGPGPAEACEACGRHMDQGVILISYDPEQTRDPENPYRTGGWVVAPESYVRSILMGQVLTDVLYLRFAFLDDDAWDRLKLPRLESN